MNNLACLCFYHWENQNELKFFCCNENFNENENKLIVKIRKSDREKDENFEHKAIK